MKITACRMLSLSKMSAAVSETAADADATEGHLLLILHLLLSVGGEGGAAGEAAQDAGHVGVFGHAADGLVLLAAVAQQRLRHRHLLWGGHAALLLQLLPQNIGGSDWPSWGVGAAGLALALLAADRVQRQLALPAHSAFI